MPFNEAAIDPARHAAAPAAERFDAAHAALRADPAVQFTLSPVTPPQPPPQWLRSLGHWLREHLGPVGRFLRWLGSFVPDARFARILFWAAVAAMLAVFVAIAFQRIRHGEWRLPRRRRPTAATDLPIDDDAWQPDAAPVRAWLREADALAAAGRYAEAAHLLLHRSVEDIARCRPQLVRPALTSRELAGSPAVPGAARTLFAGIAGLVERSLFGGRPVGPDDWTQARAAYADLALPRAWQG